MNTKLSTRGPEVRNAIATLTPFTTHGALSARMADVLSFGRLPDEHINDIVNDRDAAVSLGHRLYVVYSYDTPIAWYMPTERRWTIPLRKYSPTTSNHQAQARQAVQEFLESWR